MPLKKLWNSIRGASDSEPRKTNQRTSTDASESEAIKPKSKRRLAKPTKPKLSLLDRVGSGAEASICRLVKRSGATSVLEIGIGDGKRALSVARSLVEANPDKKVTYAAIDMFEMGDGPITLRDFNQQLREQNVKPTLVPMGVIPGLARVSSTVGMIDLILIAEPTEQIEMTTLSMQLKRLTTSKSAVYQLADEKWTKLDLHGNAGAKSKAA